METKYGLRGAIVPTGPFKDADEAFAFDGFCIEVKDGVIAIGYNNRGDTERAREIIRQYLDWFSTEHNVSHTADLNQRWEIPDTEPSTIGLAVNSASTATGKIQLQVTIHGRARIVASGYDSGKLSTYSDKVRKSQQNQALARAVQYFHEEAIEADRPLYGIYKAIEALTQELPGGRAELGILAGCHNQKEGKRYVDDIMQTSGLTRHHNDPDARRILSDDECRDRARILIGAFARHI